MTDKQEAAPLTKKLRAEYETQHGEKHWVNPVCHGEYAYASWNYQKWLESAVISLRSQLTEAVKERDELSDMLNKECRAAKQAEDERDALASKFDAVVKEVEALQAQLVETKRPKVWHDAPWEREDDADKAQLAERERVCVLQYRESDSPYRDTFPNSQRYLVSVCTGDDKVVTWVDRCRDCGGRLELPKAPHIKTDKEG